MRNPSMGGRQHWVMLVDEATKYRILFLKKKNEQVEHIIDWMKVLKAKTSDPSEDYLEKIMSGEESQTRMNWDYF